MEPEPSGADTTLSEPESAPGPRTSGAAEKSGGSATLLTVHHTGTSDSVSALASLRTGIPVHRTAEFDSDIAYP